MSNFLVPCTSPDDYDDYDDRWDDDYTFEYGDDTDLYEDSDDDDFDNGEAW